MERPSLEEILKQTRTNGPRVVFDLSTRLNIEEAQYLCNRLRKEGYNIEPYDFYGTRRVWKSENEKGIPYKRLATKELIKKLARRRGVNYRTFRGFRSLLRDINKDAFRYVEINRWGTKLWGLIVHAYGNSPSSAVIDLINNDDEFIEIRKRNLQLYDFGKCPNNYWVDKNKRPNDNARNATKELIKKLARGKIDYKTFEGFTMILKKLDAFAFKYTKINCWGTTFEGMFQAAYKDSTFHAIIDLVVNDNEFIGVRERLYELITKYLHFKKFNK